MYYSPINLAKVNAIMRQITADYLGEIGERFVYKKETSTGVMTRKKLIGMCEVSQETKRKGNTYYDSFSRVL